VARINIKLVASSYLAGPLRKAMKGVATFAGLEGLDGHGRSAAIRLETQPKGR